MVRFAHDAWLELRSGLAALFFLDRRRGCRLDVGDDRVILG
jgi:hypothetical protein